MPPLRFDPFALADLVHMSATTCDGFASVSEAARRIHPDTVPATGVSRVLADLAFLRDTLAVPVVIRHLTVGTTTYTQFRAGYLSLPRRYLTPPELDERIEDYLSLRLERKREPSRGQIPDRDPELTPRRRTWLRKLGLARKTYPEIAEIFAAWGVSWDGRGATPRVVLARLEKGYPPGAYGPWGRRGRWGGSDGKFGVHVVKTEL